MAGAGNYTGLTAKTYLNTGTHAAPVLVEMKKVKDAKLPITKTEVELDDRESLWKKFLAGMLETGLTGTYNKKRHKADALFAALMDSLLNNTPIEIFSLDDESTVSGAYGFRMYCQCFQLEKTEENGSVVSHAFTLKLTQYEEAGVEIEPSEYTAP